MPASMEDLPGHVMVEILSRLPVKTIIHCKCVCKKWLDLVSNSYFANLHLSRSPAGIMIHHDSEKEMKGCVKPGILKLLEVEDKPNFHNLHHDPLMSLDLNLTPIFQDSHILPMGSVDGLLCLWQFGDGKDNTFICNPITREYMILPREQNYYKVNASIVYGFGVSSLTKEYKVIRIFKTSTSLFEAEVYTLGTGQWRSLGHVPYWLGGYYYGPFLNGHAHWCIYEENPPEELYTFDFDNETFNLFPSPPIDNNQIHFKTLAVLKGCLCHFDSQFTVWVMKEYGIKTSWHKEVIIKDSISPNLDLIMFRPVHLIERLRDGTILMVCSEEALVAYSSEKRTIQDTEIFDRFFSGVTYRPSFLKLQNFESESVHVL